MLERHVTRKSTSVFDKRRAIETEERTARNESSLADAQLRSQQADGAEMLALIEHDDGSRQAIIVQSRTVHCFSARSI